MRNCVRTGPWCARFQIAGIRVVICFGKTRISTRSSEFYRKGCSDTTFGFTVCRYVERNALAAEMVSHAEDWRWGSLLDWLHPEKMAAPLLSPWPLPRRSGWVERVNEALTAGGLQAIRVCTKRGRPFGSPDWRNRRSSDWGSRQRFVLVCDQSRNHKTKSPDLVVFLVIGK
jgi:hypothetical protein